MTSWDRERDALIMMGDKFLSQAVESLSDPTLSQSARLQLNYLLEMANGLRDKNLSPNPLARYMAAVRWLDNPHPSAYILYHMVICDFADAVRAALNEERQAMRRSEARDPARYFKDLAEYYFGFGVLVVLNPLRRFLWARRAARQIIYAMVCDFTPKAPVVVLPLAR